MKGLVVSLVFLFSCMTGICQELTPEQYIEKYKSIAISEMKRSGVPAAITLGQGLLETENGNSDLVRESNNHFGIKCKSNWSGPYVLHDDDASQECFRAYDDAEQSYTDHSDFLHNSPRYSSLFKLDPKDYVAWAKGLKSAGYATNPRYAASLISKIEQYDLNRYTIEGIMEGVSNDEYKDMSAASMTPGNMDKMTDNSTAAEQFINLIPFRINGLLAVDIDSGMSLIHVAQKFRTSLQRLILWNELDNDIVMKRSQIIYLQSKKTEGDRPQLVFSRDLTLYEIAQSQGVRVSSLCAFNDIDRDGIVKKGTVIYMKSPDTDDGAQTKDISRRVNIQSHVVEPGESLFSISRKYGSTVQQLMEWNNMDGTALQPGKKLIIGR